MAAGKRKRKEPQKIGGVIMRKSDLVSKVADKTELEYEVADKMVTAVLDTIQEALVANEKVQIIGFGTFDIKERAAHQGRNPSTGEVINIAASKSPVFKAGKTLRDAVK
jgi:DNA-binding protein HU-beta